MRENGQLLNITELAQDISWEEGENELALRITATFRNAEVDGARRLSVFAKLGCYIIIQARWEDHAYEVARGFIVDWETLDDNFRVTCYDELFYLQQSEDHRYYSSGTRTKTALMGIFEDWKIPVSDYRGPNESHGKKLFKADALSDIVLWFLDDAQTKSGKKYVIRARLSKVQILPLGSNTDVYRLDDRYNLISATDHVSTGNLVTRVRVLGKEDSKGRAKFDYTLDGRTEYGIRQRIVTRGNDEKLADAKKTARKIIDEEAQ